MSAATIAFFGNFGGGNLGNELTLAAMIENTQRYMPAATLMCVCADARRTAADHGIRSVRMSYRYGGRPDVPRSKMLARVLRRVFVRLPLEALEWAKALRVLGGTRMLVMTGTGMLSDFGIGPFDLHYQILKWTVAAKLRGCRVLFVSVGVGPIADARSRWIVKRSLSLADYRSYRDRASRCYLESIGFDTSKDQVYPDLVFSGRRRIASETAGHRRRVVAIGLMDYRGQHVTPAEGERIYDAYVEEMARFACVLLGRGYDVRLLVGDLAYDTTVKRSFLDRLERLSPAYERGRVLDGPARTPAELAEQIAGTDAVVATRFHNVLLAIVFGRPVIALAYHEKVRALMAEAGLEAYCIDVATLDTGRLVERFGELQSDADRVGCILQSTSDRYGAALEDQYERIFGVRAGHAA